MPNVSLPPALDRHRMLNVHQMAEALGYSTEHIRRLNRAGKLPKPVVIGRRLLWPTSALITLAEGNSEQAA